MSFTQDTPDDDLVLSIKSAISMSGLLFQRRPDHDEWDTTRPGARPGEVAAFVRDPDDAPKDFISVVFHREGESIHGVPDDDPIHGEWQNDAYEIVVSCGDGTQRRDVATDAEKAAELVAEQMEHLAS